MLLQPHFFFLSFIFKLPTEQKTKVLLVVVRKKTECKKDSLSTKILVRKPVSSSIVLWFNLWSEDLYRTTGEVEKRSNFGGGVGLLIFK